MQNIMAVLLNGVAELEYDRNRPLAPQQELYLDKMDEKMAQGIMLGDEEIEQPDLDQRARFVAGNLFHAMKSNDEAMTAAMCSYLALRLPDLKQVKIDDNGEGVSIELVFDDEYRGQVPVQFEGLH